MRKKSQSKLFVFNSKGFIPILVLVAIAAISIPVTVFVLKQQVDIRQHAAESGCPNSPTGGTNSCVPLSYFSECPSGSTHYSSPDGDAACTTWTGQPSMCCFTQSASTPIASTPTQSCDQKYGTGYQCTDAFSSTCAPPNLQQTAAGTTCNTGGAYACCKVVEGPPQGPRVMGANKTCSNNQISISFSAAPVPNATSYHLIYGWGTYTNGQQQITGTTPTFNISGFAPNLDIYYDVEACNAQGCTLDPNGYFGPVNTGASCAAPITQSCDQKYGVGYQCLTTSAVECQSGTKQSTLGTDCSDSSGFQVACCKAAAPTPTPYSQPTPTPTNTLLSCDQKYGYGYQCLTTYASECQSGIQKSTVGTNCSDATGFQVACCKAAAPTPTPTFQPTPTPASTLLSCDQKYGYGYQCLTTSSSECQSGIQKSTVGTSCTDSFGFNVACCKAAAPTPTPTRAQILPTTSNTSSVVPTSCAQKYGSGYQCLITSADECRTGTQKDPSGTDCDNSAGFQMMCCKAGNPQVTATNASTTSQSNLSTTCAQKYNDNDYQCSIDTSDTCKFGTMKSPDGTTCNSNDGFQSACCKAAIPTTNGTNVYDCKSNGGTCKSPFAGCSATEQQPPASTTTCGSTSQICCIQNPTLTCESKPAGYCDESICCIPPAKIKSVFTYSISSGFRCSNDIIYDAEGGKSATHEEAALDCASQGEKCHLDDALQAYFCVPKDYKAYPSNLYYCSGSKIIYDPYNVRRQDLEKFSTIEDCSQKKLACVQFGEDVLCSPHIDQIKVSPYRPPRTPPSEGKNYPGSEEAFHAATINNEKLPTYSFTCTDNEIFTKDIPSRLAKSCKIEGKVCTTLDSNFVCTNPIKQTETEFVNQFTCNDTKADMYFSYKAIIGQAVEGLISAQLPPLTDPTQGTNQIQISQAGLKKALIKAGMTAENAAVLTADFTEVGIVLNYGTTAISVTNEIYKNIFGRNFDYYSCDGDLIQKKIININDGSAKIETKSCQIKGSKCRIFSQSCVACVGAISQPPPAVSAAPNCKLKNQGDANCDGKVNSDDLAIWRDESKNRNGLQADFNRDGVVDDFDLSLYFPTN